VKRETLFLALNETTHAVRFTESAANRFATDVDELETGSKKAVSVAYIKRQTLRRAGVPLPQDSLIEAVVNSQSVLVFGQKPTSWT